MDSLIPHLNRAGYSGVRFTNHYAFKCDQVGKICPNCRSIHDRNGFYVSKHEASGGWYVKNFSKSCVSKKFHQENTLPSFAFKL